MEINITEKSKELFRKFAEDSGNWNGMPLLDGNFDTTKEDRGNLMQLKRTGLLNTSQEEGNIWVIFTPKGVIYARELGFKMHDYDENGNR